MSKPTPTIHGIVDSILKRGNSYAYALGATESMLKEVLIRFATPEQQEKWLQEEMERQEKLNKPA